MRGLEILCNIHTSELSKYYKVFTLGMFKRWSIPYCKDIHCKAKDEEAKHMVNILDKAIKNPGQVQEFSAGEKGK